MLVMMNAHRQFVNVQLQRIIRIGEGGSVCPPIGTGFSLTGAEAGGGSAGAVPAVDVWSDDDCTCVKAEGDMLVLVCPAKDACDSAASRRESGATLEFKLCSAFSSSIDDAGSVSRKMPGWLSVSNTPRKYSDSRMICKMKVSARGTARIAALCSSII